MKNLLFSIIILLTSLTAYCQVPTPNAANGQTVCPNETHFYGDQVIDPTSTYQFSIVPAQPFTAASQQIQVTWATPGVYTMTMIETNAAGCQFTTTAQITVQNIVQATVNPIVVCEGGLVQNITGQNLGINPVFSGTGVSGTTFNPAGLAPGTYTITVTSQTANGCPVTGTGTVTVEPLPTGVIYTD